MDKSISILRVAGFRFFSNVNRIFFKQTAETLVRCRVLWHLGWIFTICPCPTKHARFIMGALIIDRINELKFDNIVNMYENIAILSYSS